MNRVIAPLGATLLCLFLSACPPPAENGGNGGNGENGGSQSDAGIDFDAGSNDDAGMLGGLGASCEQNLDCESTTCLALFEGFSSGYCTTDCQADTDCDFGDGFSYICLDINGGTCVRECANGGDCGDEGICLPNVDTERGKWPLCLDLAGRMCQGQADCEEGVCAPLTDGVVLESFCDTSPNAGTLLPGESCDPLVGQRPCQSDADCPEPQTCDLLNNVCQDIPESRCGGFFCLTANVCSGPCQTDADCPESMICEQNLITVAGVDQNDPSDDQQVPYGLCVPFQGSLSSCAGEADCTEPEEHCTALADAEGTFGTVCALATAEGVADVGGQCSDDPLTPEAEPLVGCATRNCLSDGYCAAACQTAADCSDAAAFQCIQVEMFGNESGACLPGAACTNDSDCSGGESCQLYEANDGVYQRCMPAQGLLTSGETCDPFLFIREEMPCFENADCTDQGADWVCGGDFRCRAPASERCASGRCSIEATCLSVCTADADCSDDGTAHCARHGFVLDDSGTPDPADDVLADVDLCMNFSGSKTACTRDGDCMVAGEKCQPHLDQSGNVTLQCAAENASGANDSASCGLVGTLSVPCKSNVCDLQNGDGDFLQGTCANVCVDDNDCGAGLSCQDFAPFSRPDATVKVCRRPNAGAP
jgi:hypothetical protein